MRGGKASEMFQWATLTCRIYHRILKLLIQEPLVFEVFEIKCLKTSSSSETRTQGKFNLQNSHSWCAQET